eukprot:7618221-Pyramimonas_sp.AAC.1
MVRRGRAPSPSPDRMRARSSDARSSGVQRPRHPEAGTSSDPPGQAPRAHAPRGGNARGETRLKAINIEEKKIQRANYIV